MDVGVIYQGVPIVLCIVVVVAVVAAVVLVVVVVVAVAVANVGSFIHSLLVRQARWSCLDTPPLSEERQEFIPRHLSLFSVDSDGALCF